LGLEELVAELVEELVEETVEELEELEPLELEDVLLSVDPEHVI